VKYTFFIILTLGLLSACVTQKSRQDMSKVGQFYHNVTAKYNGWFNANELVEASVLRLEEQHEDNYNEILPIYEYAAVDNADAVKADLDEAIKKVSVVVTLHEFSDWADDSYLLIGKSLYLKKDYEAAENALEYYMDEFLPNGKRATIKNKKKSKTASGNRQKKSSEAREANKRKKELQRARKKAEKERKAYNKLLRKRKSKGQSTDDLVRPGTTKAPDGTTTIPLSDAKKYEPTPEELKAKAKAEGEDVGLFGHEPVYDEAILWLAKSYIERENWTSADFQFRRLESDNELPVRVYEELPVARAYYHMQRENYPQVIPFLEQGIERAGRRDDKARYSYIIAQLYDKLGNVAKAAEYYQKSLDFSNKYDMEINTRLSIIRSSVRSKTMSDAEARQSLEKLLKDDKNKVYQGRIYYILATLALEQDDVPLAITHLENSVASVGSDKFQEIESQYLLATLYMRQFQYVEAEEAFKRGASIMVETDPRYKYVKKMGDNLRDIAMNLETIELQDSLLKLSLMTEEQLKEVAKQLKKSKQDAEAEAAAKSKYVSNIDKKSTPPSTGAVVNNNPAIRQVSGSVVENTFWAFDQKNLKKTRREFERTWGDIPLTDFWRVSSKASQYASTADEIALDAEGQLNVYESEIENFFKDVPKTDSARAISHTTIRKSMLLLGQLYRDRIEDFESSIKILEDLLVKYPDAPEKLEIYYQLYLSSLSAGDHQRADKYKGLIISLYPNSRFAKVLSDPNFAASQRSEQDLLVAYYDETFGYFEAGNHAYVLDRIRDVQEKFGANNNLMAKFEILKAMSLGATVGKEAYVDALKQVIARYPSSEEEKKARDMLLLLGDSQSSKSYGETGLNEAKFTVENNALHFVVVYVINQDDISVQDTKIALAKFNNQYFQLDNLKTANLVFDPSKNHSLVLVRSFTTKEKAMKYYETALRHPTDFLPANAIFEVYPITQKNYREVIKARTLDTYKVFFEENY
jgi:outer membrane protein assembly factor BamD (BamD/ComL family)/spore coat polysaccharide biosynthesis protein SpsF (cytidylyltransferase family)